MEPAMYRLALPLLALPIFACAQTPPVRTEVLNNSLHHPWALAFIDQGRMLVSERRGQLWLLDASGRSVARVAGVPAVDAGGQGGLLDVVADRRFADNRQLYFCYSEAGDGGNRTALARARLSPDGQQLQDVAVIFRQQPAVASRLHFGCRIVQQTDSTL
jgi:glucose/arabinose dehydrogenase